MTTFAEGITLDSPYILAILAGAGTIIAMMFKMVIASKDREIAAKDREIISALADKDRAVKQADESKKSYQEIAEEAIQWAKDEINRSRKKEGKPPVEVLAPVIPESHSPPTATQRETADIATKRASMASIKVENGGPPRTPAHAVEEAPTIGG